MTDERIGIPHEDDVPAAPEATSGPAEPGAATTTSTGAASLEALQAELAARTRAAAEANDRHLRALADFDNYRKRVAREREEVSRQAQQQILREILPVLDNFDRALGAEPGPSGDAGFRAGIELIHRDFLKALDRIGVRPFSTVGEPFDPARHQAVARVERTDVADHTVVAETLRGYLFQDRVLRPAQVVVAVEASPPPEAEASS